LQSYFFVFLKLIEFSFVAVLNIEYHLLNLD